MEQCIDFKAINVVVHLNFLVPDDWNTNKSIVQIKEEHIEKRNKVVKLLREKQFPFSVDGFTLDFSHRIEKAREAALLLRQLYLDGEIYLNRLQITYRGSEEFLLQLEEEHGANKKQTVG